MIGSLVHWDFLSGVARGTMGAVSLRMVKKLKLEKHSYVDING